MKKEIIFFLMPFFFVLQASAETINVPGDYPTIQQGINAAVDGDTVLVADGVYTGKGNKNIDFFGKPIVVRSENGPEVTVINCLDDGRGFIFQGGEDNRSVLDGFTIMNGYFFLGEGGGIYCDGSSPTISNCYFDGNYSEGGGGICCDHYSSPKIIDCLFFNNSAYYEGGGILCDVYSSPLISSCTFSENDAQWGGGICSYFYSDPEISGCSVSNNTAVSEGGGIYFVDSQLEIENSNISENTAENGGGVCGIWSRPSIVNNLISINAASNRGSGMYFYECDSVSISFCEISENYGSQSGGGIYFEASEAALSGCYLGNNSSVSGAGIYLATTPSADITNCTFVGNSASGVGGGISVIETGDGPIRVVNCILESNTALDGAGFSAYYSSPQIENCTFSGNTAERNGSGIFCDFASYPLVTNCILWNDFSDEVYVADGEPVVTYSDVQGGWVGEGNINNAPLFTQFHQWRYLLRPDSPCIDAGDPAIDDFLYDWHPRWPDWYPDSIRSDMGAYGGPGNGKWLNSN